MELVGNGLMENEVGRGVKHLACVWRGCIFTGVFVLQQGGHSVLQRVIALADVEGARIKLTALDLRHPLLGLHAFKSLVARHYTKALLQEVYKVTMDIARHSISAEMLSLFDCEDHICIASKCVKSLARRSIFMKHPLRASQLSVGCTLYSFT